MYEAIQAVLVVIGAIFIIKGVVNVARGYNIDKLFSVFINKEIPKTNDEKRK